ncbi:fungal-specific transcription factor domain-containing protein [Dactylonectria macrodidyma]|uniref:Fungal-specific transcription factor domain-containing protein n=1 Tax=Dactylonectria macrodidyma TaxID=307937 RepID=A0A9P9FPD2_9HYPO|nr:fungal-specific transcription factor domain-containing protein [Dactylonectria macrodidyma]
MASNSTEPTSATSATSATARPFEPVQYKPRETRSHKACDACKRRKVRCSGINPCQHCYRNQLNCTYSTTHGRLAFLERRLHECEKRMQAIEAAWRQFIPDVDLDQAIYAVENEDHTPALSTSSSAAVPLTNGEDVQVTASQNQAPRIPSPADLEFDTMEALEWDETLDLGAITDGIGSLSVRSRASGYMGPQSGSSLLRYLQSVGNYLNDDESNYSYEASPEAISLSGDSQARYVPPALQKRCLDWYFEYYHKAYPLLHEGIFRAECMGAISKPKDGSWPVLYNMVLAVGAFAGPESSNASDAYFYGQARAALSMDLLQRGSLHLVQAFALMANYLQKRNKPNSGFVFLGIALNMGLGLGLHREFSEASISPFAMELRRRVWWTLFIFDSGARLTFGRSSMQLFGGNIKTPRNLDDVDLAVDADVLDSSQDRPTVTSSLIWQCKLAEISNEANTKLLERRLPKESDMVILDDRILAWRESLPSYFKHMPDPDCSWFDIPRMVLLWRSQHLRIVINRPFLLNVLQHRQPLDIDADTAVGRCTSAAAECSQSINAFYSTQTSFPGSLAWYATYWLVTAVFVPVTCLTYDPYHSSALAWRVQIEQSRDVLEQMAMIEPIAGRAIQILSKIMNLIPPSPNMETINLNEPMRMDIADIWGASWIYDSHLVGEMDMGETSSHEAI